MKDFSEISESLDKFTKKKNEAYGDAYGKNFEMFGLAYAAIEVFNKVNRIVTLTKNNQDSANNESLFDSYVDLRNYAEFAIQHMLPDASDEDKSKYGL